MILAIVGHSFEYEILNICRIFYFNERFEIIDTLPNAGDYIIAQIDGLDMMVNVKVGERSSQLIETLAPETSDHDRELILSRLLFHLLSTFTGYTPRWGILTGIRPIKLIHKAIEEGMSLPEVKKFFGQRYLLREDIADLAIMVAKEEKAINDLSKPESFSLYVSIPFCPSRCSYCSFISSSISHAYKVILPYLDKLVEEIKTLGTMAARLGLRLETVYIGGGTPTTLSAPQLKMLFEAIDANFDLSHIREYTVEAGRPDTITEDKLRVIKEAGVTRLSVNPQTLQDDVLKHVGRAHTAADVVNCYHLATGLGFDNINMDLIAGLPADSYEGFVESLEGVIALSPANITVHTLTLKRSSTIFQENIALADSWGAVTTRMVDYARKRLMEEGYIPYYLYRQKNTIANLENIGYCKPGYEGLYNVYIMDETHSILSAGAGAVTKLREPKGVDILRIHNFKYPFEYINQFDEMMRRKDAIEEFYRKYPII